MFFHETVNALKPAATFDFKTDVADVLKKEGVRVRVIDEEEAEMQ